MSQDISVPSALDKTGFIFAEEEALKRYLSNRIVIPRSKGKPYTVPVKYRWADSSGAITYPYLLIDLIDIQPANDMWHSMVDASEQSVVFEDTDAGTSTEGLYYPSVRADILDGRELSDVFIGEYLPYRLMFQVSAFSNHSLDDKFIHSMMMVNIFPPRSFFVGVQADQVWRRGNLVSWNQLDRAETMESTKRVLHKVYTITVETEVPTTSIIEVNRRIEKLHVDIYDLRNQEPLPSEHPIEADHSPILDTFTTVAPPQ